MSTKLAKLKHLVDSKQWKKAIRLANSFPELGAASMPVSRASAALTSYHAYIEMGYVPEQLVEEAIESLCRRYGWTIEKE